MAYISATLRDRGKELTNFRIPVAEPTATAGAGSIALLWNDGAGGGIQPAIEAIVYGTFAKEYFGINEAEDATVNANNENQREKAVRIFLVGDDDSRVFTLTIGTVNLSVLTFDVAGDGIVLADGGVMADLVAELEAHARYPSEGGGVQTVTVSEARYVGRNT